MIIYFFLLFFCLLLSSLKLSRGVENIALAIIAFIICFGYTTGSDWRQYERVYNYNINHEVFEYGYMLVQNFFRYIGVSFWNFHIGVKLIVFCLLIRFIRLFEVNIFLFLLFFLPDIGYYLFIDCPFRNLIALGISFLSIEKLMEKKNIQYFLLVFFAMSFHTSALIMVPIFFIKKMHVKPIILLILVLLSYTLAFQIEFLLSSIYLPLSKIYPTVDKRLLLYFLDKDFIENRFNIGSIFYLFTFALLLIYRNRIAILAGKKKYIQTLSFLFLLIYPFGISLKIFQRFYLFTFPFFILSILYLIKSLKRTWMSYLVAFFFVLFSFFQNYKNITNDYKYIPYTHYLFFPEDDFRYREQYNKINSPYKE
jgi:hypothetical protein